MKDVTVVMGMGWLSFIRDPTGAVLGLWQSASRCKRSSAASKRRDIAVRGRRRHVRDSAERVVHIFCYIP